MKKLSFLLLFLSFTLYGQSNVTTADYESPVKKWSAFTYLETRAGIENETGAPGSITSTFQGLLYYNLGDGYKARVMMAAYHDFRKAERQNELYNGYVALSKKLPVVEGLTFNGDARIYIPSSRIERENKSFRTKFYVANKMVMDLTGYGVKGLSLYYRPKYSRSIYQFETGISGYVNTRDVFTHELGTEYKLTDKLKLTARFLNSHLWTFYGTRKPDVFELDFSASYQATKGLYVGLGYSIGDTTFGYDGTSFNVDLLDLTKSSIYTSLSYVF